MTTRADPVIPSDQARYQEALAWLYGQTRAGGRRHPGRAAALLALLAVPPPPNLIRVVGTNGKGSVSALLAAGLQADGLPTGCFLSPHVQSFEERVSVNGVSVTAEQVCAFVALARDALARHDLPPDDRPAFFELSLALALAVFAEAGVSHAVLEAGVGGASDATSAAVTGGHDGAGHVTNLRLVVLTNVDLDHTETLGATIPAIATEKAGALRGGVPAVTGATGPALDVIRRVAESVDSSLYVDDGHDPLFAVPAQATSTLNAAGTFGTRRANARLATAGLRLLGVSEPSIAAALATPPLPARGERFAVAGREVILDGAHDPAAAARLAADVGRPYILLFGALARKQGATTLAVLERNAAAVVVTAVEPGDDLSRFAGGARELVTDPAAALQRALELTGEGELLLIAGSLYLAGALRPLLHSRTA
ncbi:MAG TPA: hypothetical protein VFD39_05930 [Trueperaceae bacterium]|nr:hypothetical protein [Trueperaceae bacterium]